MVLQQALGYAEILDVPCAFSSNGDGFASHEYKQMPKAKTLKPNSGWMRFASGELWGALQALQRHCRRSGIPRHRTLSR